MATMDVFNSNAFSMISLGAAIEKVDHIPNFLGRLNLFTPKPIRTEVAMVEERSGVLSLIQTSERGAPLEQRTTEKRTVRSFRAPRIAKGDTIQASEIQGIRAFGSESEFVQVQQEVMRRYAGSGTGPVAGTLLGDIEATWENMRLGAVQGIVKDADGSTLHDFFTEFGVAQPAAVDFDLDNANPTMGDVRAKCDAIVRAVKRAAKGCWLEGSSYVMGLADDTFWDALIKHAEVRDTYLATQEASDLRQGTAFSDNFRFGGIRWVNYQGTDDNATIAVPAGTAKFFPVNAPGAFEVYWTPGEFLDVVNTLGKPVYPKIVPDRDRNAWVKVEAYSYPLFVPTRPLMLQRATLT